MPYVRQNEYFAKKNLNLSITEDFFNCNQIDFQVKKLFKYFFIAKENKR